MKKPAKILLLGKEFKTLDAIRQALSGLPYQVEAHGYATPAGSDETLPEADLIIVDTLPLTEAEFNGLFLLVRRFPSRPVLALVAHQPPRLRYRVLEMGFTDYLPVPYDPLDLQMRVKALLRYPGTALSRSPAEDSQNLDWLQVSLVKELIEPLLNGEQDRAHEQFTREFLNLVARFLPAEMLLLFHVLPSRRLLLKAMLPFHSLEGNWEVSVGGSPLLTALLQQPGPGEISAETRTDPFIVDLIALFNLQVARLVFVPVWNGGQLRALMVACRGSTGRLKEAEKALLERLGRIYAMGTLLLGGLKVASLEQETSPRQRFQRLLEPLPVGALVVTPQFRIEYLNPSAQSILETRGEVLVGQTLEEIWPQAVCQQIERMVQKPDNIAMPLAFQYRATGRELLDLEVTCAPMVSSSGAPECHLLLLQDVTARRAAEKEKQRSERLAAMGVMIAGIAHEIRNPLAGIKAIAQAFQDELSPDNYLHEYVRRMIRQVDRLDDMLRSLFSYARPPKPDPRACHLDQVLREVLDALREKLQQAKIRVVERVEPNLPQVYVDPAQLYQVLLNVLLNSIQAIEQAGEISIQMQPAAADLLRFQRKPFFRTITSRPYVEVVIRDTGCGISPEQMEQVFNPFFTTKTFGTGLGLSIVYQLVRANEGFVYLESTKGEGTCCYLLLPACSLAPEYREGTRS